MSRVSLMRAVSATCVHNTRASEPDPKATRSKGAAVPQLRWTVLRAGASIVVRSQIRNC